MNIDGQEIVVLNCIYMIYDIFNYKTRLFYFCTEIKLKLFCVQLTGG